MQGYWPRPMYIEYPNGARLVRESQFSVFPNNKVICLACLPRGAEQSRSDNDPATSCGPFFHNNRLSTLFSILYLLLGLQPHHLITEYSCSILRQDMSMSRAQVLVVLPKHVDLPPSHTEKTRVSFRDKS